MQKIATCCYCGTRAALVLRGSGRHELSCAACGAPLHNMKAMPCPRGGSGGDAGAQAGFGPAQPARPRRAPQGHYPAQYPARAQPKRPPPKHRKRRKPLFRKALEEIWDVVEDIFD